MKVETFNNARDYFSVKEWWKDHGMEPIEPRYLGQGFIIPGYCAIFVYSTGTPICFLENLISNKNTDPALRDEAIDILLTNVIQFLRMKRVEQITAVTKLKSVLDRVLEKHGFEISKDKYHLLKKELT